jgi:DNA-binding response OmpR family regulator
MIMEIKGRILLAEDDDHLRELVKDALEDEDYLVTDCMNGQEAIDLFDKNKFDVCLLDIMMPVKDGFTVAKKIRQQSDVIPILFISTKALIEDKIEGYQKGADDYIVKPFNMKELLLKLDVFLRRTKKMFSETKQEFNIGKIHFSYSDLRLSNDDGVFDLKQKEADLLKFLCEHPNRILKREEILMAVWGKNDYFLGRSMDVFMSKVRKYLRADPDVVLETIHGMGYRFTVPVV